MSQAMRPAPEAQPPVRVPARISSWPRPTRTAAVLLAAGLLFAAVWAFVDLRINVGTVADSAANATDFLSRTLPLDFPDAGELAILSGQTLAVVVCATLLSVLVSIPVAVLAARNTTPRGSAWLGARALIVVARAVPDVVLAIMFFRVFGLGALAGVLAMGLHSVGMVGKMYADAIEQIDEGPRTAVRAGGAGKLQELVSGVLPQVLPSFTANALHRFDINLRISVVLGFVGVDGLGFAIASAFRQLNYPRAMALALVVLVLCVVAELISGAIRSALLPSAGRGIRRGRRQRSVTRAGRIWAGTLTPAPRAGVASRARPTPGVSPPWDARRWRRSTYAAMTVAVVLASVWGTGIPPSQFFDGLGDVPETLGLFWPPDSGGIMPTLLADLWITVKIALAATLIGAVLALPVGACAARNVAPSPGVARTFRTAIVLIRGLPELVLAIVFVVITGLGPVAGALALGVGAVGLLGKLVADSLEEVDPGVELALRATGASRVQVFCSATLPQAAPAFVGHVLYQLDVNIRAATLLGIVGAGGIGFHLLNASRVLEFGVVTTITGLVFVTVMLVELLALWLRRVVS
ncbi:phosphonate ABC transporter, permease protein PhnE [Streptomyces sp. WMMC1477]|uniref:phosphonate ABC transporter, permease protein PhnE n=1 Tax=Streptomyces sp. WMMC1477 TaxID=3015155 RepID=UPI0022B727E6|nr:phosphonate ABC transporter, permease protein PhnE [Streptomyces sp. WMMC1477]MCZ7431131.1 phosphonate ABC transporter, permease protein PhnE [Streptomyces sp. WMMC1477]